jgi:hypothetical protein
VDRLLWILKATTPSLGDNGHAQHHLPAASPGEATGLHVILILCIITVFFRILFSHNDYICVRKKLDAFVTPPDFDKFLGPSLHVGVLCMHVK